MKTIRKWIQNMFGFSGREINGFLVLLPLTVIIVFSQPVYKAWIVNRADDFTEDLRKLDSLAQLWSSTSTRVDSVTEALLFKFDPNKVSVSDLQKLGFSEALSGRIASYRRKGGQFRVKSDLLKIYGVDSSFYSQLYDYIILADAEVKSQEKQREKHTVKSQNHPLASFDLNLADTTEFKSVYGIGSKLATRIVKFREGLGGFIKPQQVSEVYGLDSVVIQRLLKISFIAKDFVPRKINLNSATENELSVHPYIKKPIAKAILAYRFQHGKFVDIHELQKINIIKPENLDKIIPYVKIAD